MEHREEKIIALIAAVAVVVTALIVVLSAVPANLLNGKGRGGNDALEQRVISLNLSLLSKKTPEYSGVKKNVFSPLRKAYSVKPKPKPKPKPTPKPAPRPAPVSKVKIFVDKLEFMGFLNNDDGLTVFLASEDDVYLLKEGERVGVALGDFTLIDVSETAIEFVDEKTKERASIVILDGT